MHYCFVWINRLINKFDVLSYQFWATFRRGNNVLENDQKLFHVAFSANIKIQWKPKFEFNPPWTDFHHFKVEWSVGPIPVEDQCDWNPKGWFLKFLNLTKVRWYSKRMLKFSLPTSCDYSISNTNHIGAIKT